MDDRILFDVTDGVATIRINRPEVHNALALAMWDALVDQLLALEYRADVRCVVIASSGKNFSAGADIGELGAHVGDSPAERSALFSTRMERVNRVCTAMARIPQPILASVRGVAAGGGFGLAVAADLIVASDTARFLVGTVELGSMPDVGVPLQLVRAMGPRKAKQYCLLGEPLGAADAERFGLVNWVVPDAELETRTAEIARRLAAMPQPVTGLSKAALDAAFTRTLAEHLLSEAADVGRCVAAPDYVARVQAFLARRTSKPA